MKGTTAEQILEDFDTFGITLEGEQLLQKCLELCSQYSVTGEQIACCWLGFSNNNGYDNITLENLEHFEREELAKKKKTTSTVKKSDTFPIYDASTIDEFNGNLDEDLLAAYGAKLGTPSSNKSGKRQLTPDNNVAKRHVGPQRSISAQFSPASLSPSVATPSRKYTSRTNAGGVVATYGDAAKATWEANMDFKPQISHLPMGNEGVLQKPYKFMFEKLRDVGEILDDAITNLAEQMKEKLCTEGEWSHVRLSNNESVAMAGRICCDSVGRLNAASVLLEGSREVGGGNTVPLDLSQLPEYSLFPGQIVSLKGVNTTGNKVVVKELVQGRVLPLPHTPISIDNKGPIQMVITCGPFTTNENLLYEPLCDLLTAVQKNPPHILVLLGPLLDAAHPLLMSTDLTETHDSVINRCVKIITSSLENCGTQVVIASSSRDIGAVPVYPTPPYSDIRGITCVSDPALLDIDGIVVALSSTDIIFHLGKEEISYPPQGSDRLGRLTQHILTQQSLYPLYPPPEGMCVDYEQAEFHSQLPCTPHLMILPSELRYFIRDMQGCVIVNPERLSKGVVGGSYARLELHAPSKPIGSMVGSINGEIIKV